MVKKTIFLAGAPGVGKTTLGDALSWKIGGVHLDFDVVSSNVAAEGRAKWPDLTEAEVLAKIKDLRYSSLMSALKLHLSQRGSPLVVSAPFTREMADPVRWESWTSLCPSHALFWLFLDEDERRRRVRGRGAVRDIGFAFESSGTPKVPHHALDARRTMEETLISALGRLGIREAA